MARIGTVRQVGIAQGWTIITQGFVTFRQYKAGPVALVGPPVKQAVRRSAVTKSAPKQDFVGHERLIILAKTLLLLNDGHHDLAPAGDALDQDEKDGKNNALSQAATELGWMTRTTATRANSQTAVRSASPPTRRKPVLPNWAISTRIIESGAASPITITWINEDRYLRHRWVG